MCLLCHIIAVCLFLMEKKVPCFTREYLSSCLFSSVVFLLFIFNFLHIFHSVSLLLSFSPHECPLLARLLLCAALPNCLASCPKSHSVSSFYRMYLPDCTTEILAIFRYLPRVANLFVIMWDCSWLHWSETIFSSQQHTKHLSVSASCIGSKPTVWFLFYLLP